MIVIIIIVSFILATRSIQSQGETILPAKNYVLKRLREDSFPEQFIETVYDNISGKQESAAYEMVFKNGRPTYYFFSSPELATTLSRDWSLDDVDDYTENIGKKSFSASQFLPQYDFLLPIITTGDLVTICNQLASDDEIWWQIAVYPVDDLWKRRAEKEISRSTLGKIGYKKHLAALIFDVIRQVVSIFTPGPIYQGKMPEPITVPLSPVEKEELEQINQKVSSHGFISQIRLAALARNPQEGKELLSNLESAISQATSGGINKLVKRSLLTVADDMLDIYGMRAVNIVKGQFSGLPTQASKDSFIITTWEIANLMSWSEPEAKDASPTGEQEL